jgi:hypothetical protein
MVTRRALCGATSFLLAGAFVAFVAMQSPHLVHHFFEPELVQDECPFASSGERTGGLPIEPVAVAAAVEFSIPLWPAALAAPAAVARSATRSRAPPAPVS